jgi:hypothetical protein
MNLLYSKNKAKLFSIEKIYFFIIIIYGGMGTPALSQMMAFDGVHIIGFIIPLVFTLIIFFKCKVRINNRGLYILLIITIWSIIQTIKIGYFSGGILIIYYNFIVAYIVIKVYGLNLFYLYEYYIVQLSKIGLFFYFSVLIIPSIALPILQFINLADPNGSINIIVFTLHHSWGKELEVTQDSILGLMIRNSGFSWEPGRYAIMIIFAMFFNVIRNKFSFQNNLNFWILLLALISTFSTTGFSAFFIIVLFLYLNTKAKRYKLLYSIVLIPLIYFFVSTEEFGGKVKGAWVEDEIIQYVKNKNETTESNRIVVDRFGSFLAGFTNFKNDPIFGYGPDQDNSYFAKNFVGVSNYGLMGDFAKFGLFIGLLLVISLFYTSIWYAKKFSFRNNFIFILLFLICSFSYNITQVPIFLSMISFPVFYFDNVKRFKTILPFTNNSNKSLPK